MNKIRPQNIISQKPIYTGVLVLLLVLSCGAKKNSIDSDHTIEAPSKLIFLNYSITENTQGNKTVGFINKTIVDGKARTVNSKYQTTGIKGDLKCSQLDENGQYLQSVYIKNPLNKRIEYINDSLQFESQALKLKKSSFSLRLPLYPKTRSIVIAEVTDSSSNTKRLHMNKLDLK
ncbi:hypothetical protein [Algibacter mikhailovii]|uniref:hypothetical protein n=1 Tax=Algibacter mikhailovii TaxID=425498 RepID=UPI002493F622|nr:hypothetical protein [Algibacter mikhailovii]